MSQDLSASPAEASDLVQLAKNLNAATQRLQKLETRLGRHVELAASAGGRAFADARFTGLSSEVIASGRTLLGQDRLYVLWQAVRNVRHLELPIVEIGSFRGGSAWLLAQTLVDAGLPDLPVYVIDTFAGHRAQDITEFDPHHAPAQFSETSYDEVVALLAPYAAANVIRGSFPEVAGELGEGRFALAHVDTDLYAPTRAALELFMHRMPQGGIVVVDDYGSAKCPGVKRAVLEHLDGPGGYQAWDMGTEQVVLTRI
jgi:hypothetical protein